jgi:hypothetical protein
MNRATDWNRDERGGVAVLHLVLALLLTALAAGLLNVFLGLRDKVRVQNEGDSAVLAAGLTRARSLNAVTAANHLTGQLAALIALQDGLGGPDLLQRQRVETTELTALYGTLRGLGAYNPELSWMTDKVTQDVRAGAAIYDGRVALRKWAIVAHGLMLAAKAAAQSVFGAPAAPFLFGLAYALAGKVTQEAYALDVWEGTAVAHAPVVAAYRMMLPRVAVYADRVVRADGPAEERATRLAAEAGGARAVLVPGRAGPPLLRAEPGRGSGGRWPEPPGSSDNPTREGLPDADLRRVARSQWVRASYPWSDHWRRPVRKAMDLTATLSGLSGAYREWSDALLIGLADCEIREGRGLLTLVDSAADRKGSEPWTTAAGSRRADELFGLLVVAHRPAPRPVGPRAFGPWPRPPVAVAQALVYNPNPRRAGDVDRQPITGWDTLNWDGPVPEFGADVDLGCPRIRLGWDATIVPVSLVPAAASAPGLPGDVRASLRRTPTDPTCWTH